MTAPSGRARARTRGTPVVVAAPVGQVGPIGPVPGGLRVELASWALSAVTLALHAGLARAEASERAAIKREARNLYQREAGALRSALEAIDLAHIAALDDRR